MILVLWACDDSPRSADASTAFEFQITANNYLTRPLSLFVNGRSVGLDGQTLVLGTLAFGSYAEALAQPAVLETRDGETVVSQCKLWPTACQAECLPTSERASVCISAAGVIALNSQGCGCSQHETDYQCVGDCAITSPH